MVSRTLGTFGLILAATLSACHDGAFYLSAKSNKPTLGNDGIHVSPVVVGTWRLVEDEENGILSRGAGGACLLEKLDDFGGSPQTCNAATDCSTRNIPAAQLQQLGAPASTSWERYCHPQQKTCWVRPANGWCNRSVDYERGPQNWDLGKHQANLQFPVAKAKTNWVVVTCARAYDSKTKSDAPGCAKSDWGEVLTLP